MIIQSILFLQLLPFLFIYLLIINKHYKIKAKYYDGGVGGFPLKKIKLNTITPEINTNSKNNKL